MGFRGRVETVLGLAGAGDLFVTCQGGRDGRMGGMLGRGLTCREAKAKHMPDDTVEGAELAVGSLRRSRSGGREVASTRRPYLCHAP